MRSPPFNFRSSETVQLKSTVLFRMELNNYLKIQVYYMFMRVEIKLGNNRGKKKFFLGLYTFIID